jgi:hypothetical protein
MASLRNFVARMFTGSGDDRRQPKLSAEGLPQDRLALEAGQWSPSQSPMCRFPAAALARPNSSMSSMPRLRLMPPRDASRACRHRHTITRI